ncbi:MAG: LPS-assembly protein LptD [Burkholderiales bacterium]|nr:LPS-assembly protein LptD [Burkholderiales bacterium]
MHKLKLQGISLAVLCALAGAAAAQEGLRLKLQPTLVLLPPAQRDDALPVFLEADRLRGHAEKETEAEGAAQLRRRGQAVFADWMRYEQPTEEVSAKGNVRIEQGADVVEGTELSYNLATERGFMLAPDFTLHRAPQTPTGQKRAFETSDARGSAERMLFEGPGLYRARRASYTTCGPGDEDWYVRAGELAIDKTRDVGTARDASIVFMGTPIFYSPYLSFSLQQERKSGFLTPHYGNTSKGGAEVTVPYYWNIAPNYDATISPRVISRRGVQVATEFRYLTPSFLGEANVQFLPDDRVANGEERHAYFLRHTQNLPRGWTGRLNLNRVSDDTYFTDLSTRVAVTSQILLPNEGALWRSGNWAGGGTYGFSAFAQKWQTLQADPLAPVTPPYDRLPQLTLTALRPDLMNADFDLQAQYTGFDHVSLVTGGRLVAYPSLSVPLRTAYAWFTPKAGVNFTKYVIDPNKDGFRDSTRTLPVVSADAGLVFERTGALGGVPIIQTLEPRLYYVYIPYKDQNGIPNFDTGQQDINFATIYSENQFAGWDRINDANQITLGVSTRFISSESGSERLRAGVAQRFYFSTQQVTLPGVPVRTSSSSDLLGAVSGLLAPHWFVDAGLQYSTDFSQVQRFNAGTRYQPAPGKVVNLSYRETVNSIRQTDVSGQWPIRPGWTALGRWNYSLLDSRSLETLAGLEYNGDCWVLRVVAHRFTTATQQETTTFFVQLELNGVSRIGSNPMETLRRSIGGFVRDPRAPTPQELRGLLN